ncbi:phospholipase A2 inhibitor and Ly6/PLAUR domain-containing protein-like [Aquarana catesbeiana]|uniref:phospholipase A2 inhibitor and Ly6/PLAUR domain-containing protein-like n=1 Tax=Aquarana catesbeiana TaxID=8400 RepID=UPI003CC96538
MAMTLAGLLVLFALIPSGFSISCFKCMTKNGTSCTGSSETCPSGYSCVSAMTVSTLTSPGDTGISVFVRGCVPNNQCNITGSITFTGGNVKSATLCCDTDNCATAVPTLPATNTKSNGLTCSTCFSLTSESCSPSNILTCTGSETKCGRLSSSITGQLSSFVGCITPSVCDLLGNQQSKFGSNGDVNLTTICSNGSFYLNTLFHLFALIFFLSKFVF